MTAEMPPTVPTQSRDLKSFLLPLASGILIAVSWDVAWVNIDLKSQSASLTFLCCVLLVLTVPLTIAWIMLFALRKTRPFAIQWVIAALCFIVPICAAIPIGSGLAKVLLNQRLRQIIFSTKPLIKAIEKYSDEIHHPPKSLEVLVPKYIGKVPPDSNLSIGTGYGDKHTVYRYRLSEGDFEGPWELEINVDYPSDVSNLRYRPSGLYPRDGHDAERIDDWEFRPY